MVAKPRKWPPAYAARWLEHRAELRQSDELGEHVAGAIANLHVHLGWDGRRAAARHRNGVWLAPDRNPDATDWRFARGTSPLVVLHGWGLPDELEQARATAHNLVAIGCELVVVIYRTPGVPDMQARAFTP